MYITGLDSASGSRLEIESCLDEGTTVRIHLPYIAYSLENTELLEGGRLKQLKGERQDEEK